MRKKGAMFFSEIVSKLYGKRRKLDKIRDKFINLRAMSGTLLAHVACHVTSTWHLSDV